MLTNEAAFEVDEPSVIHEEADGEIVLVELRGGLYYRIGEKSSPVFRTLVSGHSLAALKSACVTEGVDDARLRALAIDLLDRHLIRLKAEPLMSEVSPWEFREFTLEEFGDLQEILKLDPIHESDPDSGWPNPRA